MPLLNPRSTMIVKRPSQFCKTPYVADIEMDGTSYLAHTPALGCPEKKFLPTLSFKLLA